jgi:hypothetical protein
MARISTKQARYIKLGGHNVWAKECLQKGTIRLGFGTEQSMRFRLCQQRDWTGLEKSFVREGNALNKASEFTGEVRHFFEDDGDVLWLTFDSGLMYWGFLDPRTKAKKHPDGVGVWRAIRGDWKSNDLNGNPLRIDRLSRTLTKLVGYPGTSCSAPTQYVIRRINGKYGSVSTLFPDEVESKDTYPEGATGQVTVNYIERNPQARRRCIEHHGHTCCICGFDFGQVYGPVAKGKIHVHHLRELSQIRSEYEVDPRKDLRPVCPNCHLVIHLSRPTALRK